jgi:hypothetical protein
MTVPLYKNQLIYMRVVGREGQIYKDVIVTYKYAKFAVFLSLCK